MPVEKGNVIELIDTLWNVNEYCWDWCFDGLPELIDTLWNVNCLFQIL